MKTSAVRILLCSGCLWSALMTNSNGQERDFAIKVGVEEVRIDAVILDNKGKQITDLTAADFELYQDGKPQKIIACTYVNEYQKPAPGESPKATQSKSELPKEEVRRTFVFVIDDINLCFDYYNNARMAVKKFVETQMQTGDLIAIIQNGQGTGALQRFTSDKQKIFSILKDLWPPAKPCTSGFGIDFSSSSSSGGGAATFKPAEDILIKNKKPQGQLKESLDAQTAVLDYAIKALQDMPGRKSLVFMSDHVMGVGPDYLYDEISDRAMRAGVVIDTLDMKGLLVSGGSSASDRYLPLSKKTGGIFVENSNFFIHGIKPVDEASKGYYLLSYIPPANTFNNNSRDIYHRVRVKVKRGGSEVHSRDGFMGAPVPSTPVARATTLQEAILSPFQYNDLELRLSSGYAYAPRAGYFLRSWLHLDGKDLTFTDEKNGGHILSLELMTLTASAGNSVQDSRGQQYRFMLNDAEVSRIRNEGIDLNAYLPVKKPGAYYVRAAVRDMASSKVGSGYQFLRIQDVQDRRLSLSSLFVLTPDENMYSIISGNVAMDRLSDIARKWEASRSSPARRSYLAGEGFDYMAIVYNPKPKGGPAPNLESQFTILKDGKEFYSGNPEGIDPRGIDDLGRIPIIKRMDLNTQMEEGTYQLQLKVAEKQAKGKSNSTYQTIDFEIRK